MNARKAILIIDDETSISDAMQIVLEDRGYRVSIATTGVAGLQYLRYRQVDLVIADLRLPDTSGIDLLSEIKHNWPHTEVILITGYGSIDVAIEAIKMGAYYYLSKPFTPDQLLVLVEKAIEWRSTLIERDNLKKSLQTEKGFFGMVGISKKMRQIYEIIDMTARSDASILIEGESGTGKELIATAFHLQSNRATRPLIRINCAAIPPELIESELFGYRRGAFTGADRDKRGLIETASGGTLFLDEITEMLAHLQTKLLRVLQERKLRRLGDEQETDVDFRLISATNRDSLQAMREGALREDLYFRISTVKIKVPPLRERLDDLLPLAEHFLRRYSKRYNKKIRAISQSAFSLLAHYHWSGNVRELESVIERAVLFCQGDQLTPENLPEYIQGTQIKQFRCEIPPYLTMEEIEREAIEQTLQRTQGNIKKTAQILKIHRPTLYRKLKRFKIKGNGSVSE